MDYVLFNPRRGASLLVLTVSVILMSITLSVALPRADMEIRRQKENELRYVLGQFRRATNNFHRVNNRQPDSIDELLSDSEGRRFLRRPYPDPITGEFDWVSETVENEFQVRSSSDQQSIMGAPYSSFR